MTKLYLILSLLNLLISPVLFNKISSCNYEAFLYKNGAICLTNNLKCSINYSFKWGEKGTWQSRSLKAGWWRTHTWDYDCGKQSSPNFYIQFDCDLSDGIRYEEYLLARTASWDTQCETAHRYEFKKSSITSSYFDLYDCEK